MHRIQVNLEDWQYGSLKARADRQSCSVSDVLREVVSDYLVQRTASGVKALEHLAGFADDPQASGRDHDRYLYSDS
jgi:hypothetical protein